jgi:hypothetical protein
MNEDLRSEIADELLAEIREDVITRQDAHIEMELEIRGQELREEMKDQFNDWLAEEDDYYREELERRYEKALQLEGA